MLEQNYTSLTCRAGLLGALHFPGPARDAVASNAVLPGNDARGAGHIVVKINTLSRGIVVVLARIRLVFVVVVLVVEVAI